ncbi:MAG: bifunctional diaminohydroxyphosphoribosylaminopyrimidine deaminase/5-amino-6-(5-phosphoribosylamino)uracil reductase RibD [Oligoflexales bacterium]
MCGRLEVEWVPVCDDEKFINSTKRPPSLGEELKPEECFTLACSSALQGAGRVASNPLVGVVAVDKDHKFIGLGAHLQFGQAHAEANLIKFIEDNGLISHLAGATLYCTLEPCSFHGKTPSCAKLLSSMPIKKLIYGQMDPNIKVNGRGLRILKEAGVVCEQDSRFTKESARLIKHFSWSLINAKPYVALKMAMSFDGKVGKDSTERFWITGERSRQYGHWLRHFYEGILIGAETVIVDNPSLSVRHTEIFSPSPVAKVILDPNGRALLSRCLSKHRLLTSLTSSDRVYWVVKKGLNEKKFEVIQKQLEQVGASLIQLECDHLGLDLKTLLVSLYDLGIHSLLLEGGRHVWSSFLSQQLVQSLHAFHASTILGGENYHRWDDCLSPIEGTKLVRKRISPMTSDWLIEADLKYPGEVL